MMEIPTNSPSQDEHQGVIIAGEASESDDEVENYGMYGM